jgi:hypothetical protein
VRFRARGHRHARTPPVLLFSEGRIEISSRPVESNSLSGRAHDPASFFFQERGTLCIKIQAEVTQHRISLSRHWNNPRADRQNSKNSALRPVYIKIKYSTRSGVIGRSIQRSPARPRQHLATPPRNRPHGAPSLSSADIPSTPSPPSRTSGKHTEPARRWWPSRRTRLLFVDATSVGAPKAILFISCFFLRS